MKKQLRKVKPGDLVILRKGCTFERKTNTSNRLNSAYDFYVLIEKIDKDQLCMTLNSDYVLTDDLTVIFIHNKNFVDNVV